MKTTKAKILPGKWFSWELPGDSDMYACLRVAGGRHVVWITDTGHYWGVHVSRSYGGARFYNTSLEEAMSQAETTVLAAMLDGTAPPLGEL